MSNELTALELRVATLESQHTSRRGVEGARGEKGDPGVSNMPGATGPQGPRGETGPQGAASNVPGPAGAQGPAGATGPQGERGAQGVQGAAGVSDVAGPAGAQGETGPTGATGATGAQGPQGVAGVSNVQGPMGAQGLQGPIGANGLQGIQGIRGEQGKPGNIIAAVNNATEAAEKIVEAHLMKVLLPFEAEVAKLRADFESTKEHLENQVVAHVIKTLQDYHVMDEDCAPMTGPYSAQAIAALKASLEPLGDRFKSALLNEGLLKD